MSELDFVQAFWLILLSGFSSAILFFIWKNLAGYQHIGVAHLWRIATQKIGDEKQDLGILTLSLALLCWFVSGLFLLHPDAFVRTLSGSLCSSLNSCFLLLFLRHLDKEDLPSGFRAYFPSRHTIWTVFIIVLLVTFIVAGFLYSYGKRDQFQLFIPLPDLAFSLYTLYFIGLSFFYLLTARMKSIEIGILSAVPIVITLLAELFRLYPHQESSEVYSVAARTMMFAYKPLLIITYFVLIYSWQLKRINHKQDEKRAHAGPPMASPALSIAALEANRAHYLRLGERDWLILESLAKGEKATAIAAANPAAFPNGAKGVDDRVGAIAREFKLEGQSQMNIVITALKRGLLRLEDIS